MDFIFKAHLAYCQQYFPPISNICEDIYLILTHKLKKHFLYEIKVCSIYNLE